jgi:hypothetical protein
MSHVIQLPDDVYQTLEAYAAQRGQTPEAVVLSWARALREQLAQSLVTDMSSFVYDPADDPLATFLGTGELIAPDAIRRHDEAIAEEALDAHGE